MQSKANCQDSLQWYLMVTLHVSQNWRCFPLNQRWTVTIKKFLLKKKSRKLENLGSIIFNSLLFDFDFRIALNLETSVLIWFYKERDNNLTETYVKPTSVWRPLLRNSFVHWQLSLQTLASQSYLLWDKSGKISWQCETAGCLAKERARPMSCNGPIKIIDSLKSESWRFYCSKSSCWLYIKDDFPIEMAFLQSAE